MTSDQDKKTNKAMVRYTSWPARCVNDNTRGEYFIGESFQRFLEVTGMDVVRLVVTYGRYGAVTFSKLTKRAKISVRSARDIS
jgi:hypothetical protein